VWISDVSIRRPVFAVMLIGALVALGLISVQRLGVDLFPRVEFPVVTVTTILEGATPETVESEVTDVLEEHINTISGIERLGSRSSEGRSQVFVRFELEEDPDVKAQDVRDKVALARWKLPREAEPPIIEKLDPDAYPILAVMVAGDRPRGELTRFAKDVVKERLERIRGVGSVKLVGGREREVCIWLDLFRLRAYGLTADDVVRAIQAEHADLPGGRLDAGGRTLEFSLKTKGEVESISEFGDLIVAHRGGATIRIRDVGRVEDGLEEERTYAELDGVPGVSLLVRRQSGRNTVAVARAVKAEVEQLQSVVPPGVRLVAAKDMSRFIESSIRDTGGDMAIGGLLAVIVTLLFLRSIRSTLIVGIAIPAAIVSSFFFFYVFGFTLNMLTLMGLSVCIGILIDDAIVMLENIYRHIEAGEAPMQAARSGVRQIAGAVLAGSFSIMAVFLPIGFMGGIIGRFFHEYGLAVVFAVGVSLLIALTLTPTLCARALRHETHHGGAFELLESLYTGLERFYRRLLEWALGRRAVVAGIAVAAVVFGLAVRATVPMAFDAGADRSEFDSAVELHYGTGIEETKQVARRVVKAVRKVEHVRSAFLTIGAGTEEKVNEAEVYVALTPKLERGATQKEIMNRTREAIQRAVPDAKSVGVTPVPWITGGGYRAYDIEYAVRGPRLETLQKITDAIAAKTREDGWFTDVSTTFDAGRPEVRTVIDRRRAAELGIPVRSIASTLRALVGGIDVATFEQEGKRYDVHVRLEEQQRDELAELGLVQIRAPDGRLADLANVATLEITRAPAEIEREDRARKITVLASLVPGVALGPAVERFEAIVEEVGLPRGYNGVHLGPADRMRESARNIRFAFWIALLALYMILASQFNSFTQPAIIMLAAPLSFAGAFTALALAGATMTIFAQIGLIILMGLVMKNGILLVDYANQRRKAGASVREAMLEAGPIRLRPVMMTTFSTVCGMIPVAFATSGGAEFRSPMGLLIIGGLLSSMFLTLIVVPVAYTLEWELRSRLVRIGRSTLQRVQPLAPSSDHRPNPPAPPSAPESPATKRPAA
jgi:HAE1 family hydrophobic/amphiphilic exporter-1